MKVKENFRDKILYRPTISNRQPLGPDVFQPENFSGFKKLIQCIQYMLHTRLGRAPGGIP